MTLRLKKYGHPCSTETRLEIHTFYPKSMDIALKSTTLHPLALLLANVKET